MKKFIKYYWWHLILWFSFIVYETLAIWTVRGKFSNTENYLFHYLINIPISYLVSGMILPCTIKPGRRNIPLLMLLILLTILIFLIFSNFADRLLAMINGRTFFGDFELDHIFVGATMWRGIYFMGIGVTLFLYQYSKRSDQKSARLEKQTIEKDLHQSQLALELAEAKNAYLRAQINPHFMLSTLSFIHDSTRITDPKAGQAVLQLSKVLRYALDTERGSEKTLLRAEIEQAEILLNITRIRKEKTFINLLYDEKDWGIRLIPFILPSLTENMLKHGNLSISSDPGEINVAVRNNWLFIETRNLISTGINDSGLHTGLVNIEQRLRHSYGERANISYRKQEDRHFTVNVCLPIE
ncbi:sensor histidine kinase [Pedobacter miscanthi]|uniref:Signal transduction histidine kinase internal region domain-containing protein n=1 Tax=Pedobacter miscanthi TaxID=2259170 RepID=A0A366L1W0_9SPHI|nr:histidine kinase [Pedobacter miscanthi]RBQ07826.1 hypothetical protein DRW42_09485 [Pedobacter miscanthi]